jgi:hypothetical protein
MPAPNNPARTAPTRPPPAPRPAATTTARQAAPPGRGHRFACLRRPALPRQCPPAIITLSAGAADP